MFLERYNARFGTDYQPKIAADCPDVRCVDSDGNKLNLEITLTQNRPDDIKAIRDGGYSHEELLERLNHINRSPPKEFSQHVSSQSGNVADQMVETIKKKMNKNYGSDVALVVRDTSGVPWDWDEEVNNVRRRLDLKRSLFDHGIWIVTNFNNSLVRVA